MNCSCGSEAVTIELRTGADGGPAGIVNKCHECGNQWQGESFKTPTPSPQTATVNRAAAVAVKPGLSRKLTDRSLVSEAKLEIKRLNREIARLEKLKRQRDELVRLVGAATSSGGPRVVPLKRAESTR